MSNSEKSEPTIDNIINEIKEKSSDGDYIYRGERQPHCKVSSALYREYIKIRKHIEFDVENFDLTIVEKEMLKEAKKHIGEPHQDINLDDNLRPITHRYTPKSEPNSNLTLTTDEIELLTQLQHYGGETNLIDFTTDFLIAIFFACSGNPTKDGRVIVLEKTEKIKKMIILPQNPQHRVIGQKSVFLRPPQGFIAVRDYQKVCIPSTLKRGLLMYLRQYHGISTETIYNDIYGFIRHQNIQKNAYVQFYLGQTRQLRGYHAEPDTYKESEYIFAIEHYNHAINLNPDLSIAYYKRGECWLHLGKWNEAKRDLISARNMGIDLFFTFHIDHSSVEAFEKRIGIKIPDDIANMIKD